MKKVVFVLGLVLLAVLLPIKVCAGSDDSYVDWNLDRGVFAHQYRNNEDHITNLAMITTNGITSYCIEPGVLAGKASYYSSTTNIYDTKLRDVDTKRLSLIGYYGYGYEGHNVKEYYMAAQELIWRLMGVSNVWWTDAKSGGNIINIDYYKNEILRLVDRYEVTPKINLKSIYMVGDKLSLEDSNNVIGEYELVGNSDANIVGNKLNISIKEKDNSFILRRKQNGKTTKFYYKDGYQTIGSFEFPYSYEKKYTTSYTYGKIIVDKKDYDTKSKVTSSKYATLEGAEYGLYDSTDKLIEKKKTDKDGKIVFDKLPKGNYSIREIKPSKGYSISETITYTFVGSGTLEVTVTSYEKIIKNKIVIIKNLDDEENKTCTKEKDIKFGIYDEDGNLIKEEKTNEDGEIIIDLPYGKYIIKQLSTPDGVDMVKDTEITVEEDGKTQNIVLINHKIKKPPEENPPENEIPELPNTGDNNLLYSILLLSFSIIGIIYEKKHI